MPEETDDLKANEGPRKPYQPPVLTEYGTIAQLTGGKTVSGTDLLPGTKR